MAYSAQDMMMASRIAYYNIDNDLLAAHNYQLSMRDILKLSPQIYEGLQNDLKNAKDGIESAQALAAIEDYNRIIADDSSYGDWVIRQIHDTNSENGFYGCLIETSDSEAIVGFRGSESGSGGNCLDDWLMADAGLLHSVETAQQHEAEKFMQEIAKTTNYGSYSTTGHSLGGNLAMHAAIAAPEELQRKLNQVVSLDGPGFSAEYLLTHKWLIDRLNRYGHLVHYRWSPVGHLLTLPDGTVNVDGDVEDEYEGESKYILYRHDLGFVELDEDGNIVPGRPSPSSALIGKIAGDIESGKIAPSLVGGIVILLELANIAKIVYAEIDDWIKNLFEEWEKRFGDLNVQAKYTLSVQRAAEGISHYAQTLKELDACKERLETMRKDSSYLKIGSLAFQLAMLYQEGKIDRVYEKTDRLKEALGQILNEYQNSERRVVSLSK